MLKRTLLIGEYDTASHGWTLAGWKLSDPEQKTNYIEKTGGDGSWDLSTAQTDGIPRYKVRSFSATLECSEGTRADREKLISEMVNKLDGFEWSIVLPDHPDHYITGRLHVAEDFNNLAHAKVNLSATVAPWLYKKTETIYTFDLHEAEQTAALTNSGRLAMVPQIGVTGEALLEYGTASIALSEGVFEWPDLLLTPGEHAVKYSGEGKLTFTFREAVLR